MGAFIILWLIRRLGFKSTLEMCQRLKMGLKVLLLHTWNQWLGLEVIFSFWFFLTLWSYLFVFLLTLQTSSYMPLLILSLANAPPPLWHALAHLNTRAHPHPYTCTYTDHSAAPACRRATDWLLPRRLGFVDVRNRTGTPDHREHRKDWWLCISPPPTFLSIAFIVHVHHKSFILPHNTNLYTFSQVHMLTPTDE